VSPGKRRSPARLGDRGLHVLRLRTEYHFLAERKTPIEAEFWRLEQQMGKIRDRLANMGENP